MKLHRFSIGTVDDWVFDGDDEVCIDRHEMMPSDDGDYYRASEVNALLTDIRRQLAAHAAANLEAEFMAMLADTGGER